MNPSRMLLAALLLPAACLAGPADLDPGFGLLGKKLGDYGPAENRYMPLREFGATDAGYAALIGRPVPFNEVNVFLVRFDGQGNETGATDLGVGQLRFGDGRILADGRAVLAYLHYLGNDEFELRIARHRADGAPDPTFGGGDGHVAFAQAGTLLAPSAIDVLGSGQIVVTGFAGGANDDPNLRQTFVARVDNTGVPILGFSGDGLALHDLIPNQAENPAAVAMLPTGQVLICDRGEFGGQSDALLTRLTNTGDIDIYGSDGTLYYDSSLPAGANQDDRCTDIDVSPVGAATVMTVGRSQSGVGEGARRVPVDDSGNAGAAFDNVVARYVRDARLAFDAQGRSVLMTLSKRPGAADFDLVRFTAGGAPDAGFGIGGTLRYSVSLPAGTDADAVDLGYARAVFDVRGRILTTTAIDHDATGDAGWEIIRLLGDVVFQDGFE